MCFQHTFSFGLEKSRLNTVKLTVQTEDFCCASVFFLARAALARSLLTSAAGERLPLLTSLSKTQWQSTMREDKYKSVVRGGTGCLACDNDTMLKTILK